MTTETNKEPKPEMSLALSCPLPVEEGQTAQLSVESPRTYRIFDVRMPEGAEAIGLMAGLQDVSPAAGETWSALLAREPVHVTKGQHVMVIGRNLLSETRRLTASVVVRAVDDASRAPSRASIRERTTVPATPSGRPAAEPIVRAADEPNVRFLIERAYVTYLVAYVQNGAALPRALRAAIGTSFESSGAVVDKIPAKLGSSVVVEMPAAIRAAIGASSETPGPSGSTPRTSGPRSTRWLAQSPRIGRASPPPRRSRWERSSTRAPSSATGLRGRSSSVRPSRLRPRQPHGGRVHEEQHPRPRAARGGSRGGDPRADRRRGDEPGAAPAARGRHLVTMQHLCFSGSPACSGVNPCVSCAEVTGERVLPAATIAGGLNGSLLALVHLFAQTLYQVEQRYRCGVNPANLALSKLGIPLSTVPASPEDRLALSTPRTARRGVGSSRGSRAIQASRRAS